MVYDDRDLENSIVTPPRSRSNRSGGSGGGSSGKEDHRNGIKEPIIHVNQ